MSIGKVSTCGLRCCTSTPPSTVTVVDPDPVVRWQATLAPGQVARLRWTARLSSRTTMTQLGQLAVAQREAEQALVPRLSAIAAAAHVALTSLVPFPGASLPDPGLTSSPSPVAKLTTSAGGSPARVPTTQGPVTSTSGPTTVATTPAAPTTAPPVTRSPAPTLKAPGVPRAVLSGNVVVVAHKYDDPKADPTYVTVGVSWGPPGTGGAPSTYCVRWTVFTGSGRYGGTTSLPCAASRAQRFQVPHVNPADSWLRWEVQARNAAGGSVWQQASAVVADLVGGTEPDAVDKLRAAGLRVNFTAAIADSSYSCTITDQSPRSGTFAGGTFVRIYYKECPP